MGIARRGAGNEQRFIIPLARVEGQRYIWDAPYCSYGVLERFSGSPAMAG